MGDELVLEVPEAELGPVSRLVKERMDGAYDLGVFKVSWRQLAPAQRSILSGGPQPVVEGGGAV